MNRRRFVAALAAGTVSGVAGCTGVLDDATSFSATPVEATDAAAEEAGYDHQGTESIEESREFASQSVEVTNYFAEYTRSIGTEGLDALDDLGIEDPDPELGVFAALSSPQVGIGDQQFNPLDDMNTRDVVDLVQEQYESLSVGDSTETREVGSLGQTIEVHTFEGSARFLEYGELDVLVDASRPDHGDDHLALVGVYPASIPEEGARIETLLEGLQHEE